MDPRLTDVAEVVTDRSEVVELAGPRTKDGRPVAVLVKPIAPHICAGIMQSWAGGQPLVGPQTPAAVDQQAIIESYAYPLIEASVHVMRDGALVRAFARDGSGAIPMELLSVEDAASLMVVALRVSGRPIDSPEGEQGDTFPDDAVRDADGMGSGVGADGLGEQDRADAVAGM